jgi:hypothetical protein
MGKYKFQVGGSTDFFNQLAQMYAQQFNESLQQPEGEESLLPEEMEEDGGAAYSDSDYDDLLAQHEELQSQFNELSQQLGQKNSFQDDSFLDFLFSGEDDKMPIDPNSLARSAGGFGGGSSKGINPFVLQTQRDLMSKYNLKNLGIWGDKSHQQRESDHNSADAQDFGFDDPKTAQQAVAQLQSEAQQRGVKYIIYDKKIWNPEVSNEWRPYNGSNPHTNHFHVSYKRKMQSGGVAITPEQQYQGLNDPKYNKLLFPNEGMNTFRGLDNGQPVLLQDQLGNQKVLKGKYDVANFYGNVIEHRL